MRRGRVAGSPEGEDPKTTYVVRGRKADGAPMKFYHRSSFVTLMARAARLGMVEVEEVRDLHGLGPPPSGQVKFDDAGVGSTSKRTLKVKA